MPRLSLVTLIVISLLGCCMEIDLSIPSFPGIMEYFGATEAQVQNTLSVNFLAFCLSGLLYGPFSDAWGRRRLMLWGATCFLIGALGCVFSGSINQLMAWRFVQGLGASATVVLGMSMISDRYSGALAAKYIGRVNAYCTIFMASAPIFGSIIVNYFSWRANFTAIAGIALFSWILLIRGLPETKPERALLNIGKIFKDYWIICTHPGFLLHACMPNFLVTAYLSFVGSSAFYYMNTCNLSVMQFSLHQGSVVASFSVMSFYADRLVTRVGAEKALKFGMLCVAAGTALLSVFSFVPQCPPLAVTLAMCLFCLGCAFPMSVTFARSLEILPELKGACASFIMSSRLLFSAAAVGVTGLFFDGSMRPVALIHAAFVVIALLAYARLTRAALRPASA